MQLEVCTWRCTTIREERKTEDFTHQIQASAPASSCFTLSGYFSKSSHTTLFSFDKSAPGPASCGTAVGRRARALMDVMDGLESACLMTSVATKPVEPATMSFILYLWSFCFLAGNWLLVFVVWGGEVGSNCRDDIGIIRQLTFLNIAHFLIKRCFNGLLYFKGI